LGDTLTGEFLNVIDGGRLETTDGLGSFLVNYGTGADANEIVLSDFEASAVPEPAMAGAFGLGFIGLVRRKRKTNC
jgi:hypothetical protein